MHGAISNSPHKTTVSTCFLFQSDLDSAGFREHPHTNLLPLNSGNARNHRELGLSVTQTAAWGQEFATCVLCKLLLEEQRSVWQKKEQKEKDGSSRLNERREQAIERHLCCATVSEKKKKKIFSPYGKKIHEISVRKSDFLLTLMLLVCVDCHNNWKQKVKRREAGRFEHLKRDFFDAFFCH